MLISLRLGTNDLPRARAFYDATFTALGGNACALPEGAPIALYRQAEGPAFLIGPAADGEPATHANGGTILFAAPSNEAVDAWYAAALANGGTSEGEPGARERARGAYGAYVRDPDGNKLGAYHGLSFS